MSILSLKNSANTNSKPWVKICGITTLDDALTACEAGADAVGFIFAPSKRAISPKRALAIIEKLPLSILKVGVFMDAPLEHVQEISDETGIDLVQLHGTESQSYCDCLEKPVIKRLRVSATETQSSLVLKMSNYTPAVYLLDPGAGDGQVFNWHIVPEIETPIVIAGGLAPENVRQAVRLSRPFGVDVASGVEDAPGIKSKFKILHFIQEARCQ